MRASHRLAVAVIASGFIAISTQSPPAHALTLTVDAAGHGAFTNMSAAVQMIHAYQDTLHQGPFGPDSIIVMPGSYPETLTFPDLRRPAVLMCPSGAGVTQVQGVAGIPGLGSYQIWYINGLAVIDTVSLGSNGNYLNWAHCWFKSGYRALGGGSAPNIAHCEFDGPVELLGYSGGCCGPSMKAFEDLFFKAAPLTTWSTSGNLAFRRCTFVGPAPLAVSVAIGGDFTAFFEDCQFTGVHDGIRWGNGFNSLSVSRCRFDDLTGIAIQRDSIASGTLNDASLLVVSDSYFHACGSAVRWTTPIGDLVEWARDTSVACQATAFEADANAANVVGLRVEQAGGAGIVLRRHSPTGDGRLAIDAVYVARTSGDGITLSDAPAFNSTLTTATVVDSRIDEAGGDGIRTSLHGVFLAGNVVRAARGDGISVTSLGGTPNETVESNTSVQNFGDGIRCTVAAGVNDAVTIVRNNLSVANSGGGLRLGPLFRGRLFANDAWVNYAGQYIGPASPADSNLTVDPRFCNLSAGDVSIEQGSPCASTGPYGLIGALPASCPSTASVAAPHGLAFTVGPNPASGRVNFRLPDSGPPGEIAVTDLQGRRVWSRLVRSDGSTLTWTGESIGGHAAPGLYWVRYARPGESRLTRLVWLK